MPGGRLTQQDRRHIAEGLAEGLGYAEIARRLARPTSTVSREVTRNGGPDGYRPDQAHQATEQRARRRKPTPTPTTTPATTAAYGRDPEAVRDFEEGLTALIIQTGLPRMMARVLTSLYTTDTGSLTAAELIQRLQVSPASISNAIGYLEEQELVRRERDPRGRRERYVIDDDVWYQAWIASARSNAMLADAAEKGAEILGANTPAGARLKDMSQFLGHTGNDMIKAAEHWRQVLSAQRTTGR
ncbi:helix-turn-helix domain-containing protein [Nonomuraea sp. NPDC046570]|uniref:GbsR/MarR family transcriptional regulator n=1 Tax=Nonomuraea sp. NPDC046570 TaxID=3155255 RepID=UPI0033C0EE80